MSDEFTNFDPKKYLAEYYREVSGENKFLLDMAAKAYADIKTNSVNILELGGGPTVYQLISAARVAKQIDFSDFSQDCLDQVQLWLDSDPTAFNWDEFIKQALLSEGASANAKDIKLRSELLKSKITKLFRYDLLKSNKPLPRPGGYQVVSNFFASDAITDDLDKWRRAMSKAIRFISGQGYLIMCGVFDSNQWHSQDQTFVATNLNKDILLDGLKKFGLTVLLFDQISSETNGQQGYSSVFFVKAQKLAK